MEGSYTEEVSKKYWEEYQNSFLIGEERKERFGELIQEINNTLPEFLEMPQIAKNQEKIILIALSGSSVYGPRKKDAELSDIDINFLLDSENGDLNFDMIPKGNRPGSYHFLGTGKTDFGRGSYPIHWMLYPHYPIKSQMDEKSIKSIIAELVDSTQKRSKNLYAEIEHDRVEIYDPNKSSATDWKK